MPPRPRTSSLSHHVVFCLLLICAPIIRSRALTPTTDLWLLHPVSRPEVPQTTRNPIDAFIESQYTEHHLKPVPPADKLTLLRRVYLDLIGLPPTPVEQDAFLNDSSPDAYEKVVDRLLASDQYGVRYGRHWLDVLRYADADENMIAAKGMHLWRDWVIRSLNDDIPYDDFVRAQLTGNRSAVHTQIISLGYRVKVEPRPDDIFALGFLARGQVLRDGKDVQELPITAVDTISTAFMGLTVGCAKCHDHMYDPIKKRDYYAMKALFDPLVLRKIVLATPEQIIAAGKAKGEAEVRRLAIQKPLDELVAPYKKKLYDERVLMLPDDVRAIVLKPEKQRTAAEQKIADDYYPVLRIDPDKFLPTMTEADRKKYQRLQKELADQGFGNKRNRDGGLPVFWTVEDDPIRLQAKSYELTSADPDRPELNHEVQPSWPFGPDKPAFRDGRREAFSDWLTAPQNPMFARVAVNRLWQWHFGEGLEKSSSDFGMLGGMPSNPKLLDWLASEFVARGFSMKQINRLIVTSDTYKLASEFDPATEADNIKRDQTDTYLWHFRLERLEAEPIWDSIFSAAGDLDLTPGGTSFDPENSPDHRRGAYITRGYSPNGELTPNFLRSFDVDDGRTPCPLRTQTVTAPQALFAMNSPEIDAATTKLADRLKQQSHGDLHTAVALGYRMTLGRPPTIDEDAHAQAYLQDDPKCLKGFAWLLLNLDEFVYVR